MKTAALLLVIATATPSACTEKRATTTMPDGQKVGELYIRDANSGRCVRLREPGKMMQIMTVNENFCRAQNFGTEK